MAAKFLKSESLLPWLEEMSGRMRVLAPRVEGDAIVFRPFERGNVFLERDATAPPKGAVFPASEDLVRFSYRKNAENPGEVDVEIKECVEAEPTLVFGTRPCGARGFQIFDRVYLGEKVRDCYYAERRDKTLFATMACDKGENSCFCHWVGSGPADPSGSDLLFTPVEGGYVVEAVSERAAPLLDSALLADAGAKAGEAEAAKTKARESLGQSLDLSDAPAKILDRFDDMAFWEDVSAKCISCGACTYLCPTCYCFNITDETTGLTGKRSRSWDNCMSFQFTLEASGHNPRPTKAHRLKNRVGHKFSYYPNIHGGLIACCGCGRCVKSCPASVDIREIVARAIAYQPKPVAESAEPATEAAK